MFSAIPWVWSMWISTRPHHGASGHVPGSWKFLNFSQGWELETKKTSLCLWKSYSLISCLLLFMLVLSWRELWLDKGSSLFFEWYLLKFKVVLFTWTGSCDQTSNWPDQTCIVSEGLKTNFFYFLFNLPLCCCRCPELTDASESTGKGFSHRSQHSLRFRAVAPSLHFQAP